MKKILAFLSVIVTSLLMVAYFVLAPVGYQGSGYTAKNLCSGVFVSGLDPDTVMQQAILPASPPLVLARYSIDKDKQRVSASMLGLYRLQAQYRKQLGCTLIPLGEDELQAVDLPEYPASSEDAQFQFADEGQQSSLVDQEALSAAIDYAFAENDSRGKKNTKAVLVLHRGLVIAERYAEGVNQDSPLLGWSMSKSITNMLVGVLVKEGRVSLDQPAPISEWKEGERSTITVNNLLQMSSGLEFNETYGMATDVSQMLTTETDAGAFAASKPAIHPPGEFWSYSSGTSNILARMVFQQAGGDLASSYRFYQENLFQPLAINNAVFEPDASGVFIGSSYLYASTRDWAKLGQLMLQKGQWQGQQILPDNWMNYSITPASANSDNEYGAHFWLNLDPDDSTKQRTWPDVPAEAFSMNGYQGQHVVIIPSQELVVVRLGFTPRPARPGMNELLSKIINSLN